ncbi:hypothetical protein N7466_001786 [Penicillium verhagenii]|uniref:uncharacterized protein n=1 Tax=Penicillium verhagenii TaxID=1562060 RepID=UPI0025457871|nr:uncharacterized protein N7466_001786 [Penicillium verhagenii]KAJ5938652.1 hypothetical protein N7466_001786 [Penicillium verhagenii]
MVNKQNKQNKTPVPPVSFDEIIQSDRQKKQREELANSILGKNRSARRASAPGAGGIQKSQNAKPGSLASRIGVPKRSASTANLRGNKPNSKPNFKPNPKPNPKPAPATAPTAPAKKPARNNRQPNKDRLQNAIESGSSQATIHSPRSGLSIKGASGPFIVIGSNFAPGTTAADIQSALEPTSGPMLSCRVISHNPTVTAEFAFENKWNAENVVANYHHQRADGRLLSMVLKPTGSAASANQNEYSDLRVQADRERKNRRAEPSVQDGRYGFDDNTQILHNTESSGLYSDNMMVDAPQGPQPRRNNNQNRQRR